VWLVTFVRCADIKTGLYYVHARYYNPNLGRFMQTDPIGTQGGNNLYAYVNNDPVNMLDPLGLSAQEQTNDNGSGTARATEAAESATNFAMANYKIDAAGAAAMTSETMVGAVGAAYLGISAAGSGTAGTLQAIGAATGWTDSMEYGAEAVSTVTSAAGFGTLLATGDLNKAATAAAWEGIVTSNPTDLTSGGTLSRVAHAADLVQNISTVANSAISTAKSVLSSYINFAIQHF
jgi:RHS repeat-associated protein